MKTSIALDIGTSSTRAVVFTEEGEALFVAGHEYHSFYPRPMYVEQEPATWIDAADRVLGEAGAFLRQKGMRPEGIAVTSQRTSLIPLDADGKPLRTAIMWQDKRNLDECALLVRDYGMENLYRRTGLRISPVFALTKILWLKTHQPEIFAQSRRLVGIQDYVVLYLTGQYKTDWTQASRTMLMDLEKFHWDHRLLEIAGIHEDRLCQLVPPGSVGGHLLPEVAARTDLPAGLPVVISGGDQQCAAMGLGVVKPGMAEANTGTGSFVVSFADRPAFDADCRVLCQASAMAGKWVMEAGIFNTGSIFRWFKERFCPDVVATDNPYDLMTREAAGSPAGANGVVMLPHFEGSFAPNWNPAAKGIFFNLSLGTTRADMMRAILDGIALEIRENLELIQSLTQPIDAVSVAGGMVRSDLFCQIQASAYGKKVIRYENSEASALGACIVAAPALGIHDTLEKAFAAMAAKTFKTIEPDPNDAGGYALVSRRRRRLYEALNNGGAYSAFL